MLKNLGLHGLTRNWLSDSGTVLYAVMFPMIWQYIGHYIIIFLAGVQSIPEDILESARMDGANSFQIFLKNCSSHAEKSHWSACGFVLYRKR